MKEVVHAGVEHGNAFGFFEVLCTNDVGTMLDVLDEIEIWIMKCGSDALIYFGAHLGRWFVGRRGYYTQLCRLWKERGVMLGFVLRWGPSFIGGGD